MTRADISALAVRHKLTAAATGHLEAEYAERMAICTVEGGLSEEAARVVALEDCERYAAGLAKGGKHG